MTAPPGRSSSWHWLRERMEGGCRIRFPTPWPALPRRRGGLPRRRVPLHPSQILSCGWHRLDGLARFLAGLSLDDGADVGDPFALLSGDACPVVRVGGVGHVLVLTEFVH